MPASNSNAIIRRFAYSPPSMNPRKKASMARNKGMTPVFLNLYHILPKINPTKKLTPYMIKVFPAKIAMANPIISTINAKISGQSNITSGIIPSSPSWPTKPLAEQHFRTFKEHFEIEEEKLAIFTGYVSPEKREELWKEKQIIFSTPQGLENDIIGDKIDITNVSLVVFDEAHRATGDYSYVFLAKQYLRKSNWPRVLALTASPGSDALKIEEVCNNLGIEAVEIRTENDPDVKPYIQEVDIEWIKVELPQEFKKIQQLLQQCIKGKVEKLKKHGIRGTFLTKKDLLRLQAQLHARLSKERDFEAMKCVSILAEIMKAQHALELLETQGMTPLIKYI